MQYDRLYILPPNPTQEEAQAATNSTLKSKMLVCVNNIPNVNVVVEVMSSRKDAYIFYMSCYTFWPLAPPRGKHQEVGEAKIPSKVLVMVSYQYFVA